MDRYRVAPARPVFLSGASASAGRHHLQPLTPCGTAAGRRSGGAELGIFAAERYFNAADVVKCSDAVAVAVPAALPADEPPQLAVDAASQSGRTAVSSEASWNSRSGLLSSNCQSAAAGRHKGCGSNGVAAASDQYQRGGKKPVSGQRWGLFGRDCPCAGRKAVTVDVASETRSPTTPRIHARFDASSAMEETTIFKPKELPPPTPSDEPAKMKLTPGSCVFPLPANNNIFAAAPNKGGGASFSAFPPDVGRRVVSSGGFTFPVLGPAKVVISTVDEPPRESLEVFRPIDEDSVVLADPPPTLSVARGGLSAGFPRAPAAAAAATEEDAMSDTSSELFDLESFAASSSYPTTYRGRSSRRNSGDEDLAYAATAGAERVHVRAKRGERGVERGHGRGRRLRRGQCGQLLQRGVRLLRRRVPLPPAGTGRWWARRFHRRDVPHRRPQERRRRRVLEQLPVREGGQRRANPRPGGPAAGTPGGGRQDGRPRDGARKRRRGTVPHRPRPHAGPDLMGRRPAATLVHFSTYNYKACVHEIVLISLRFCDQNVLL